MLFVYGAVIIRLCSFVSRLVLCDPRGVAGPRFPLLRARRGWRHLRPCLEADADGKKKKKKKELPAEDVYLFICKRMHCCIVC